MIIHKITVGFVTQVFDTETGLQSQEFTAGDQVDYEHPNGEVVDDEDYDCTDLPYEPFDMVQPDGKLANAVQELREVILNWEEAFPEDIRDLNGLADLLVVNSHKTIHQAWALADGLDTNVRDEIPQSVWDFFASQGFEN
jgi:hypothetical protein